MRWGRPKPSLEPRKPPEAPAAAAKGAAEVWSIVGCGPSLDWSSIDPPDPVICINRAIQGATRCDYWCCIDSPNAEHKQCLEDARRLMPVVITQKRRFLRWGAWGDLGLRCRQEVPHQNSWVQSERKGGPRYSVISAIAWAVHHGAREIRFYGVDMSGRGYHTGDPAREVGLDGQKEKNYADRWRKRWEAPRKELDQVRRIYQAASQRGIRMIGLPEHVTGVPCPTR